MSLHDTQTSIEYMYDRRRVSKMIMDDINATQEIVDKMHNCLHMLQSTYLMGPHFNQKGNYLSEVGAVELTRCMYRIMEVTMPVPNGASFSSVAGQSASALKTDDKLSAFKIISSVISYMYFAGLLKIIRAGDSKTGMMEVIPVYTCDKKITAFIKQSMYLPPMVCMPNKLTHNKSSGYLTIKSDSLILKSYNHHDQDICIDSLNKFNSVAYSLDIDLLTTYSEEYNYVPGSKSRKGKEIADTPERKKQFNTLMEDSYGVYKMLIQSGNNFHFTHKVDKRGRTYTMGYHISPQGDSFRKAMLNLAHQEIVDGTFT